MHVIAVNPDDPRQDRVDRAVEALSRGGIVAMPTETFYGLAVDAGNPTALERVNALKGKPPGSPVLLLVDSAASARLLCARVPEGFDELAEMFWPGPLTLVVPAADGVAPQISAGRGTVGVRVPSLGLPRRIAEALGRPISGVSANRYAQPPCRTAAEVPQALPDAAEGGVCLLLDGGPTQGAAPSTVLDLSGARPRILREGIVPPSTLRSYLPDLLAV